MVKALACSVCIMQNVLGPPLRGLVHSSFAAAANLAFADDFVLSLNAVPAGLASGSTPLQISPSIQGISCPLMPNGILLSAQAGKFPFTALRPGMPVVLGAGRLLIEPISCSLDLTTCSRWDPHIYRPADLDRANLQANALFLTQFCQQQGLPRMRELEETESTTILELARKICGRGPGLTPSGDDFLAGWLAAGWLLYGPWPDFLALCRQISELARQRTHLLSQCWLAYAAAGNVALPVGELLSALTTRDRARLEQAVRDLLALGATSGFALLQGILSGIADDLAFS